MSQSELDILNNGEGAIGSLKAEGVAVDVYRQMPTETTNTLRIIQTWPRVMTPYDAHDALYRAYGSQHMLLSDLGPLGNLFKTCTRPSKYSALILRLGYKFTEEPGEVDGKTIRDITFESPTIPRLNEFLAGAFPNEESVTYAEWPGGLYPKLGFMKRFIKAGEIWTASEVPHQTHDIVGHDLAWIGIGGTLLADLRNINNPYLERLESDGDFSQRQKDSPNTDTGIHFHSPELILQRGEDALEYLSGGIGVYLGHKDMRKEVKKYVRSPFSVSTASTRTRDVLPLRILTPIEIRSFTDGIISRFDRAQAFAQKQ